MPATAKPPGPGLSRRTWLVLGGIFALAFIQFWVRTTPVRLANTDDIVFQELADQNTTEQFTVRNALAQGRFYYTTPPFGPALSSLYAVHDPRLFSLLRAIAFFGQVVLAGALLARVTQCPAWGATLALFIVSVLHIPLTFYPLLSYPFDWLGFMAVLVALHFHQSHLQRPRAWTGIATGACLLFGCVMHEIFVLFLPLFAALSWARRSPHWVRETLAPAAAVFGYVAVYLLFARLHPTTYQGTQLSMNWSAAGQVLIRQMTGILPGFELIVRRPTSPAFEPLLRSGPEIWRTLRAIPWPDLGLALLEAAALAGLLLHCSRHRPPFVRRWPLALLFAVALNLPIAFSAKYQVFLMQRTFPYAYAFYSFFFLGVVLLSLVVSFGSSPLARRRVWIFGCGLGLVLAAACWSAAASNVRALQALVKMYN